MVQPVRTTRVWRRFGWLCALFLLLLNSAQASHICSLENDFQTRHGNSAQLTSGSSVHTFCAICAANHSPSLAAPIVSLSAVHGSLESRSAGQVIESSAQRIFALYIRPPPAL